MPETVEVCRLCLSKEGLMLPIFQDIISKNETPFRSKIMSCASIEVFADDDLPSKVCYLCVHQVEKFFQFQAMCENSDFILRSKLKEDKVLHQVENNDKSNPVVPDSRNDSDKYNSMPNYLSDCYEQRLSFDALTCNICSSIFSTHNLLIDHLIKNHPDLNLLFCKFCKVAFSHVNQFKNHLNLQHSLICKHCSFVFKHEKNLKDHLKIHDDENLACKFCNKLFQNFYELKQHEFHHSEKICSYCTKELDSKSDYNSHYKNCVQKYYCKFCKESFRLKKDLIEHVNNLHDSCELEKCDTSQDTTGSDDVQEQKFDNSTEDEILQCRNCQFHCKDELSLVNHMSEEHSNSMLTCKFCEKKFGLRSSLKRHERSHSGVKPYQCQFCPRKFKDSSACVVHTRTHTGEHPFRCQECHKDFKQLANLKMHTYRHHKKNKKSTDVESEILNESGNDYEHLYTGDIMENYTSESMRNYQNLNETIPTSFNQDINILMPDTT